MHLTAPNLKRFAVKQEVLGAKDETVPPAVTGLGLDAGKWGRGRGWYLILTRNHISGRQKSFGAAVKSQS
jgi:hypothetical protein